MPRPKVSISVIAYERVVIIFTRSRDTKIFSLKDILKYEQIHVNDDYDVIVYSVQIRDVGRFLAKFNPWTNTFGNRLVRLHCSRIHPSVKLSTPKVYSCRIVENQRFELLKINLHDQPRYLV